MVDLRYTSLKHPELVKNHSGGNYLAVFERNHTCIGASISLLIT